jgi:hypothetical protein
MLTDAIVDISTGIRAIDATLGFESRVLEILFALPNHVNGRRQISCAHHERLDLLCN